MAISTYAELKTAIANWMARSDLTGDVADFITLGEAALNRELPAVETDGTLTGVVDSRRIDISALSLVAPIALYIVISGDEELVTPRTDGTFAYAGTSGRPTYWGIDGNYIDFDCPLDQAYTFRLRYRQRFALSDSATTNWLLTNHPDVYLAACLVWGGLFVRSSEIGATFAEVLRTGIPQVKNIIAQKKRAVLTVDPALQMPGHYNWQTA